MSLSASHRPSRRAGASAARLGADFVLLDAEGRMLRGLNATAARVWELMDGRLTAAEIAARVAEEFSAPEARVVEDVLAFLEQLSAQGLLEMPAARPAHRAEVAR